MSDFDVHEVFFSLTIEIELQVTLVKNFVMQGQNPTNAMRLPIVMRLLWEPKTEVNPNLISSSVNHHVTSFRIQAHSSSDEISSQSSWLPPDLFSTILISNTSSSSEVSKSISERSSIVLVGVGLAGVMGTTVGGETKNWLQTRIPEQHYYSLKSVHN